MVIEIYHSFTLGTIKTSISSFATVTARGPNDIIDRLVYIYIYIYIVTASSLTEGYILNSLRVPM